MRIEKTPRGGAPVAVASAHRPRRDRQTGHPGSWPASCVASANTSVRIAPLPPPGPTGRALRPSVTACGRRSLSQSPAAAPDGNPELLSLALTLTPRADHLSRRPLCWTDRRRAAQLRRVAVDETAGRFKGIPPGRGSRGSDRRSIGRIPIGPRRAAREQRGHRRHAARRLAEDGASRERRHQAWGLEILTAVSQELRSWTGLGRGRLTRQGAVVEGEVAQLHGLHRGDVRYLPRPLYVPRLARVRDHRRR